MAFVPPARHLLRARDLADARYAEPLGVDDLAAAALRTTDRSVADVCLSVGLRSIGSFTTSFGRAYGLSPTAYRAAHPPASKRARVPTCVLLAWARPQSSRFGEDSREEPG